MALVLIVIGLLAGFAFTGILAALIVAIRRTREERAAGEAVDRGDLLFRTACRFLIDGGRSNVYAIEVYERQIAIVANTIVGRYTQVEYFLNPRDVEIVRNDQGRYLWTFKAMPGVQLRFRQGTRRRTAIVSPRHQTADELFDALSQVVFNPSH